MRLSLVTEPRIKIHGITLRDGKDQRHNATESKTANGGDELFGRGFFCAVINHTPAHKDDAHYEHEIAPPFDPFTDGVTDLLIAAKDVATGSLGQGRETDGQ